MELLRVWCLELRSRAVCLAAQTLEELQIKDGSSPLPPNVHEWNFASRSRSHVRRLCFVSFFVYPFNVASRSFMTSQPLPVLFSHRRKRATSLLFFHFFFPQFLIDHIWASFVWFVYLFIFSDWNCVCSSFFGGINVCLFHWLQCLTVCYILIPHDVPEKNKS